MWRREILEVWVCWSQGGRATGAKGWVRPATGTAPLETMLDSVGI